MKMVAMVTGEHLGSNLHSTARGFYPTYSLQLVPTGDVCQLPQEKAIFHLDFSSVSFQEVKCCMVVKYMFSKNIYWDGMCLRYNINFKQ